MADKTPVRYAYDGSSLTGIAEYATSDTVGIAFGGTGATSLTDNGILIGNATSAIQVTSALTTNGQIVIGGTSGPAVANITGTSNEVDVTNGDGTIAIGLPAVVNVATCVITPKVCITSQYVLPAADGSAGQLMCTNGSGALAFATVASTSPGGSDTYIQFNNSSAFGGSANLTWDDADLAIGNGAPSSYINSVHGLIIGDTSDATSEIVIATTTSGVGELNFTDTVNTTNQASISVNHNTTQMDYNSEGGHYFSLGGTETMRIQSGKVGIGTTAPDGTLHVYAGSAGTITAHANADDLVVEGSTSNVGMSILGTDAGSQFYYFGSPSDPDYGQIMGHYNSGSPHIAIRFSGIPRMQVNNTSANAQGTGVAFIDCCCNYAVIGGLPPTGSHGLWIGWDNGSDQGIVNGIHTGTEWKPIGLSQNANLCINAGSGYTAFGADYGRITTCTETGTCSRMILSVCADGASSPMPRFHVRGQCMNGCFCSPYCGCFGTCFGSPTKNFEIEHPLASDESPNKYNMKHLVHSTLEGPEYGVYYRGSGQLSAGAVKVDLPEYFEALADKTDATVQLTPIGGISNLTVKLTDDSVLGINSFCVCTDDSGDQAQCFHWEVNSRRIDKHILCNIAQGDRPGACDDGRLCVERWEYRGEMENIDGIDTMTCAELDDFIEFNNTWDKDDPDFVTDYETASKANKIIMIGNAFDAIQNSAEGGKTDFSEEEEE